MTPDYNLAAAYITALTGSVDTVMEWRALSDVNSMYNMGKADHAELDFIAMCVAVAERHADDPSVQQRLRELRNAEF